MDSLLVDPPGAYLQYLDIPGDDLPVVWIRGLGCASSADFAPVVASPLRGHCGPSSRAEAGAAA